MSEHALSFLPVEGRDANKARAHMLPGSIASFTTYSSAAPLTTVAGRVGSAVDPTQNDHDDSFIFVRQSNILQVKINGLIRGLPASR